MKEHIESKCEQHEDRFDCPDAIIHFSKTHKTYGIIIHDGGSSYIKIDFCPWCGKKLSS
jgi:hypothetical protein